VLAQHALGAGLSQGVPPVLQERLEAVKQEARAALEAQTPPPGPAAGASGGAPVSEEEARAARAHKAHESMLVSRQHCCMHLPLAPGHKSAATVLLCMRVDAVAVLHVGQCAADWLGCQGCSCKPQQPSKERQT
jgi:hypothetical protein